MTLNGVIDICLIIKFVFLCHIYIPILWLKWSFFENGCQNLTVQVSVSAASVDATRKRVERTVSTDSDSTEVDVGDVTTG